MKKKQQMRRQREGKKKKSDYLPPPFKSHLFLVVDVSDNIQDGHLQFAQHGVELNRGLQQVTRHRHWLTPHRAGLCVQRLFTPLHLGLPEQARHTRSVSVQSPHCVSSPPPPNHSTSLHLPQQAWHAWPVSVTPPPPFSAQAQHAWSLSIHPPPTTTTPPLLCISPKKHKTPGLWVYNSPLPIRVPLPIFLNKHDTPGLLVCDVQLKGANGIHLTAESDSSHRAFQQSTPYGVMVGWKTCEERGGTQSSAQNIYSTTQHSTTWWSDWKCVRKDVGLRAQHRTSIPPLNTVPYNAQAENNVYSTRQHSTTWWSHSKQCLFHHSTQYHTNRSSGQREILRKEVGLRPQHRTSIPPHNTVPHDGHTVNNAYFTTQHDGQTEKHVFSISQRSTTKTTQ